MVNQAADYIRINKKMWNDKTDVHVKSSFYNVEGFRNTRNSLKEIELNQLGDVCGKSVLHLQCHFGMDSLSLASRGAIVTGIDLSDTSIEVAKQLSHEMNIKAEFICCDLYDLKEHLDRKFDIVFTSYGTILWLPDLKPWAEIVAHFLKPDGEFHFIEFHPFVYMFDHDFNRIEYSYFNSGPIVEETIGTYADRFAPLKNSSVAWNHSLSEIFTALFHAGLQITLFEEFDYSPFNCFGNMKQFQPGKWRVNDLERIIPMVYGLKAEKR
jgi:SAM-dependent methyltransferase